MNLCDIAVHKGYRGGAPVPLMYGRVLVSLLIIDKITVAWYAVFESATCTKADTHE